VQWIAGFAAKIASLSASLNRSTETP